MSDNGRSSGMAHVPGGGMNEEYARNTFVTNSLAAGVASLDADDTYTATIGLLNIFNTGVPSGAENFKNLLILPRKIQLTAKAANDNATDMYLHFYLDQKDRYSTGGTTLVPNATNSASTNGFARKTAGARVEFGELTLAAASSSDEVLIWQARVAVGVMAIDDQITINFAMGDEHYTTGEESSGIVLPPVFIGQGANLSVHLVATSQTADPKFMLAMWHEEYGNASG